MDASLPIIVISDCHGCYHTMVRLLNACPKPARVILLGDLIDRGPHSRKVVEWAMEHQIPTTAANHEDLALAFYNHPATHCAREYASGVWLDNGGNITVTDWPTVDRRKPGCEVARDEAVGGRVPDKVLDWMGQLPAYIIPDAPPDANGRRLLLSHCGYGLDADKGTPAGWFRALWGRHRLGDGPFTQIVDGKPLDDGYHRVFGHTQAKEVQRGEGWIMIDTGAAYGKRGYGNLTAFIWPTHEVITVPFDESPIKARFTVSTGGCIS